MNDIRTKALSLSLLVVFMNLAVAEESPWKLRKNKKNIQVYTQKVAGSAYKAVKTTTVIKAVKLASLVALIKDTKSCKDWAPNCEDSYVFKKVSDQDEYVYTLNDMPFPVTDRDVLSQVTWQQNPDTLEVAMLSVATVDMMDKIKGKVRLTDATVSWSFKPLDNGDIQITNQAHIDPGSSLPGWVTNMLLVSTPYKTMKAFVKEVVNPKYKDASYDFIKEISTKKLIDKADEEKTNIEENQLL